MTQCLRVFNSTPSRRYQPAHLRAPARKVLEPGRRKDLMKIERTFLIAPAVVRLMQRERVVSRDIIEGYLTRAPDYLQFVRIEPDGCNLLLATRGDAPRNEERAKVSGAQAKALLGIAQGKIMYRRTLVRIGLGLELS